MLRLQREKLFVLLRLLALQLQQVFLRLFLILLHVHPRPGQELIDIDMEKSAQLQHQGWVRHAFTSLPFGDRPVCDPQLLPQGGLGVAGLFPALGDECADFFLIHGRTSFLT